MATKMDDMQRSLEDLEKEVTCAVCLEHYTEPKVLPCLHYYCKKCIVKMAIKKNPIACPDCRKVTKIMKGEEDELPTAHFVNRLKELHARQEKAMSKEVQCESCMESKAKAEAFCQQCKKFICKRCIECHSLMKAVFEGHDIVSMSEIKRLKVEEYVARSPAKRCQVHDEPLKLYCYRCKKIICLGCTVIDHKDHKVEFNNMAAGEEREVLLGLLKHLSKVEGDLDRAINEIDQTGEEIDAQGKDLARDVEASFEEMQAILMRHKNQLLNEVKEKVQHKKANLNAQKKSLSLARGQVHSITEYTTHCVQHCSDNEIMSEHEDIAKKIRQELTDSEAQGRSIRPVEEVDVAVEVQCAEALQELFRNKARLTQVPIAIKFKAEHDDFKIFCPYKIQITVTLANGKHLKGDPIVQSKIDLPTRKRTVIEGKVKKLELGKYSIECTPRMYGRYKFSVVVKNNGSPDYEAAYTDCMENEPVLYSVVQ